MGDVIDLGERRELRSEPMIALVDDEVACPCENHFRISLRRRSIECTRCGRAWAAYDLLLRFARSLERLRRNRERIRRDVYELKIQRSALILENDRLEKRARALKEG